MNLAAVLLLLFFITYALFVVGLMVGWRRIAQNRTPHHTTQPCHFSVIIACRNEATQLPQLFKSLRQLDFPHTQFEVVFIDDHSEDQTFVLLQEFAATAHFPVRPLQLSSHQKGKKAALALGIQQSKHNLIATTDADCILPIDWLKGFETVFQNPEIQFCAGAVLFNSPEGALAIQQHFYRTEFLSLMGSGGAIIGWDAVLMANGANMAFRKSAYLQVGGHERSQQFASGDDVFLLHHIKKQYPQGIDFLPKPPVFTDAPATLKAFWKQRLRWAGKASGYKNPTAIALSWGVFLAAFFFLMAQVFLILGVLHPLVFACVMALKILPDYLFLKQLQRFYHQPMRYYFLMVYGHPIYIVLVALAAPFVKNLTWKSRTI